MLCIKIVLILRFKLLKPIISLLKFESQFELFSPYLLLKEILNWYTKHFLVIKWHFFSLFFRAAPAAHTSSQVPRLGVKSELQLLATATATWDSKLHLRPTTQLTATPDP